MPRRMLLVPAAEVLGVSKHFLRTEAMAGRIPHYRAGNRYIFDVDQVDEYLKQKALESLKSNEENIPQYGKLRKISPRKSEMSMFKGG